MVTLATDTTDFWASLPQPEVLSRMAAEPDPDVDWLWEGFLARGSVTLLTSQWKTGKTTLLSVLLARLHTGGELAGRKVQPGRVVVLSEEDRMHWRMRSRRLDFGPHTLAYCRPFKTNPSRAQWQAMVDELVRRREQEGLDLVVFDTLSMLLPLGTESQFDIFNILRPLEALTSAGVAILLMHHPRKGNNLPGQAARGTGALTAYADIVVEMAFHSKSDREDRRRELASWSRHAATPAELTIELTPDGLDYRERPRPDPEVDRVVEVVSGLANQLGSLVPRRLILDAWPDRRPPSASALHNYLARAVAQGLLVRTGTGHRADAFLYGPPGMTEVMSWILRWTLADNLESVEPAVAQPPAAETPEANAPEANAPEAVVAVVSEPVVSEPVVSEPVVSESVAAMSEPVASEVVVAEEMIDDESDTVLDVSQCVTASGAAASEPVVDPEEVVDRAGVVDLSDIYHQPPRDAPSFHPRE